MSGEGSRPERELVARRIAEADPALDQAQIADAIDAVVATNRRTLKVLADALDPGCGALHSGAPPSVGCLIVELRARGSRLAEPACGRCGRSGHKLTASDEGGVCPRCRRRQLATACTGCGVVKPVAGRDPNGLALCAVCAPRPRRACSRCGRIRVIARRAHDGEGDVCDSCYKGPLAICRVCGRRRPCNFAAIGSPICMTCAPRRAVPCAHCSEDRPACAQWPEGPVCEGCYRAALSRRGLCASCGSERRLVAPPGPGARLCADCAGVAPLATCRACGAEERPYKDGRCVRCALDLRARQLIGDIEGPLGPVHAALLAAPQPYSAHNWLRSSAASVILGQLAAGTMALSHETLDAHPNRRGADYLRHLLVANGVLAPRDDALARLEAWVTQRLAGVDDREQRRLLRSYATWRVLRRARQRAQRVPAARTPTRHAKVCLNTAVAFLGFLATRDRDLARCTQADIDEWMTEGPPGASKISDFLDWTAARNLTARFSIAGPGRREGPRLADDTRWATAARVLHDEGIELADRVAASLVLLYGQQLSRIVALRREQVTVADSGEVHLHLGTVHIDAPPPLDALLVRLGHERRPYSGVGSPAITPWLFPGLDPGLPLTAYQLGQRLRRLGIKPAPARRAALSHLAAHLPAAMLARLLNITPTTAVRWTKAVGADWTTYAAQIVHDHDREP